jgi:hypothetical protein
MSGPYIPRNMQQPFAESLASSHVSSCALSRASQVFNRDSGSADLDDRALNMGDGTQQLEDIFNNITAGTIGPLLAEETFRASQHKQSRQQHPPPHLHTHATQSCTFQPAPPPPPNPPRMSREQADFETAQFALKQAKLVLSAMLSITSTIRKDQ